MEKDRITASCIKKFVKVGRKYNNEVYVLDPGDEWGHLYLCRSCGEIIYSYDSIKEVNQKLCPKCSMQADNNFVNYPDNILLNGELYKVDETQLVVRIEEPTEIVTFFKL